MFLLVGLLLTTSAEAKSSCKDLKPKQAADPVTMALINGVISGAQLALTGTTANSAQSQRSELQDDDLAKAWFLYQICTLKEADMLSSEKAEELVELVLTGGATDSAAAPAPAAASGASRGQAAGSNRSRGSGDSARRGGGSSSSDGSNPRREFAMANRDSLPNLEGWIQNLSAVQACGSGTTMLTVGANGSVQAAGPSAACIQAIASRLSWSAPGSYTVIVP